MFYVRASIAYIFVYVPAADGIVAAINRSLFGLLLACLDRLGERVRAHEVISSLVVPLLLAVTPHSRTLSRVRNRTFLGRIGLDLPLLQSDMRLGCRKERVRAHEGH